MGWGISDIANAVSGAANSVGKTVSNTVNQASQGNLMPAITGGLGAAIGGPLGGLAGASAALPNTNVPQAPGVDAGLNQTLQAQQQNATQFRADLPQNEQNAQHNLAQGYNTSLNNNLTAQNASDNSRGLLYGGVNQGHQQQQRSNNASNLAQGRESINDQYNTAANQMDAAAVGTGAMVQQSSQAIQDQIYQQALQQMMLQNSAFGSLAGAAGMGAGMALA